MKKMVMLFVFLAAVLCMCAAAEGSEGGTVFHSVDASRISVELPDGMAADVHIEDGVLKVVIDDAATDWQHVLSSGCGYPYMHIRPTIQKPNDFVTGQYAFNGSIGHVSPAYIVQFLETEILQYESDHLSWSNGEEIGEIVADRSLFIPRNSEDLNTPQEEWGGTVICWVDSANPDYRYYEKAVFCFTHTNTDPFHVPLRFVSKAMLEPVQDMTLPAGVELTRVENGEVTFTVLGSDEAGENRLSVPMLVPDDASSAYIVHEGGYAEELEIANGIAAIEDIHFQDISRVEECQYTVVWKDENDLLLDYGLLWVHVVPPENDPWACYVENWYPVDASRVLIDNGAAGCGVEITYAQETGVAHIGYDNSVEIASEPGDVIIRVKPPEGAVCFRENRSGGNVIMGRDEWVVNDQISIVLMQEYQLLEEGETICIRDYSPMREVQAGPVSVYIQDGDVWPYGGSVNLFYWYDSVESAMNNPENPMRIEYICETNDVLCQVKRTAITPSEDEITQPVTEITAVGDYGGWKLVVKRYPQKGSNAFHWDLQLENETGVYQPLTENMVFYVPYPPGHDNHTAYTYELRHYDDAHGNFSLVDVQRTPYGLRFEVSSLSPFVFSWEELDVSGRILTLPRQLYTIESEAFSGLNIGAAVLPDDVVRIGDRAFADCSFLADINLPASIEFIASDAFSGCAALTARVAEGSYAYNWCIENHVSYVIE